MNPLPWHASALTYTKKHHVHSSLMFIWVHENWLGTQAPDFYIRVIAILYNGAFQLCGVWMSLLWATDLNNMTCFGGLACSFALVLQSTPAHYLAFASENPFLERTGHTIMNLLAVSVSLLLLQLVHSLTHVKSFMGIWLFSHVYRISVTTSTPCQWWRGWWWTWKWGRRASRYRATVTMRWIKLAHAT